MGWVIMVVGIDSEAGIWSQTLSVLHYLWCEFSSVYLRVEDTKASPLDCYPDYRMIEYSNDLLDMNPGG